MHFLLLLLRLVLDRLFPTWRDGLSMAARADGRIEHVRLWPGLWESWLRFTGQFAPRSRHQREKVRAHRRQRASGGAQAPNDQRP
jgi:hypothetical protein